MAVPLPKKVTDLIGRQVYWSEDGEPEVPATVLNAEWTGTVVRLPNGSERAGMRFLLDVGDDEPKWSMTYPVPRSEE